jgi:ParB family chromosome partitioning protein
MNKNDQPRRALGKGLASLLPTKTPLVTPPELETRPNEPTDSIGIDQIDTNPLQPRRTFQADRLAELAQSIRANGIIQPLVLRKAGNRYQLVAGERRFRAAQLAGLTQVPAVIRNIPDDRLLEITLIENIQREDLSPIETAHAFDRMASELSLTPDEIGRRTGKDRSTVTNFIRLLQLPPEVQQLVSDKQLSASHARCLLPLPTPELQCELARKAVAGGWSVRQMERLTAKLTGDPQPKSAEEPVIDPNVKAAITELMRVLGTRVRIVEKPRKGGRIEIDYYSDDDLQRIYDTIVGEN